MGRRKLLKAHVRVGLFGIPDEEESLIRHCTLSVADRLEVELRRLPFRQAARKPCEASLCALSCIHLNCCGEQTFTLPPHFLCEIARKYLSTLVRN